MSYQERKTLRPGSQMTKAELSLKPPQSLRQALKLVNTRKTKNGAPAVAYKYKGDQLPYYQLIRTLDSVLQTLTRC